MTTKGLRHLQIRENAVRESVQNNFMLIKHIEGKVNLADIFTKEDRDALHYMTIRDLLVTSSFPTTHLPLPSHEDGAKGGVKLGLAPSPQ